ncbi:MAG: sugar kinase [Saprospiraceae bacterium]|nr:sugar kinase [Saprospiraceae bacterium]
MVVTFGEIMARLATPGFMRLRQTRTFDVTYAGAEASVAVSIVNFGGAARYVTALPQGPLGEAAIDAVRSTGVETSHIIRPPETRLGLYFLETGANQRPSNVIYDRSESAIAVTPHDHYGWERTFSGADWLHLSGITPALSKTAAMATKEAAVQAKAAGLKVSIDLNFRGKLWRWKEGVAPRELARETMSAILQHVDVVIGNEEDCHDVLGISAGSTDVHSGDLETDHYPEVAREVSRLFSSVKYVAITLRESLSASHNNWGAMLYDVNEGRPHFAPLDQHGSYRPYQIKNIVDRVGGGDAFAGGLIFALTTPDLMQPAKAIRYAVAASCLKHSIKGDFNYSTRKEVEALMGGSASGRVVR